MRTRSSQGLRPPRAIRRRSAPFTAPRRQNGDVVSPSLMATRRATHFVSDMGAARSGRARRTGSWEAGLLGHPQAADRQAGQGRAGDWLGPAILDDLLNDPGFAGSVELRDHVRSGMYPYRRRSSVGPSWPPRRLPPNPVSADDRSSEVLGLCRNGVLALQDSWHPRDFQSLSASEVLAGRSTMSRLLARTLE